MTRVKPVMDDKALSEQLVAEHLEMELVKEGYCERRREGVVHAGPRYDYVVEIKVFRIPKTVRLTE